MSATVAIAASSAANAAAMAASARARKAECMVLTDKYDAKTATVEQAREYASCIHALYGSGEPIDPVSALLIKIAIALAFIGAAIGSVFGFREDGVFGSIMLGLLGACVLPLGLGAVILAGVGLQFLFS